ncbi:MAG: hypothetical protein ACFFAV_18105 [Candidatus Hermodarchaeota archaeon]
MSRKTDLNLIIGYLIFSIGLITVVYSVITLIIGLFIWYNGIVLYVKDILFELVFILLGFIIIRKHRTEM